MSVQPVKLLWERSPAVSKLSLHTLWPVHKIQREGRQTNSLRKFHARDAVVDFPRGNSTLTYHGAVGEITLKMVAGRGNQTAKISPEKGETFEITHMYSGQLFFCEYMIETKDFAAACYQRAIVGLQVVFEL